MRHGRCLSAKDSPTEDPPVGRVLRGHGHVLKFCHSSCQGGGGAIPNEKVCIARTRVALKGRVAEEGPSIATVAIRMRVQGAIIHSPHWIVQQLELERIEGR
jgi:hypothetical protein